ncbi:MAG TPA: lipoprotein insertase outer membrane protein LolB [Gammaproteobacteria bacterium]
MIRGASALAAAALLAGCGGQMRVEHDGLTFAERESRLHALDAWEMRGRLAIDTGEDAYQAGFSWLQQGPVSTLSIRGPFGGGILEVSGSPDEMTITSRGERRVLDDPERDLSALLGWWMPVESLRAWLLGLPDPAFPSEPRIGPADVLRALDQRRWHLEYEAYQLVDGVLVPRRIDLAHDTLEVRLTVDGFRPAAAAAASP